MGTLNLEKSTHWSQQMYIELERDINRIEGVPVLLTRWVRARREEMSSCCTVWDKQWGGGTRRCSGPGAGPWAPAGRVCVLFDSKAYVQHNDWPIERHIIRDFCFENSICHGVDDGSGGMYIQFIKYQSFLNN